MRVFRLAKEKPGHYRADDLSGNGAALAGGRWNPRGMRVLDTCCHASTSLLEALVHMTGILPAGGYYMVTLDVPDRLYDGAHVPGATTGLGWVDARPLVDGGDRATVARGRAASCDARAVSGLSYRLQSAAEPDAPGYAEDQRGQQGTVLAGSAPVWLMSPGPVEHVQYQDRSGRPVRRMAHDLEKRRQTRRTSPGTERRRPATAQMGVNTFSPAKCSAALSRKFCTEAAIDSGDLPPTCGVSTTLRSPSKALGGSGSPS